MDELTIDIPLKYEISSASPIERNTVLDHFMDFIDHRIEMELDDSAKECYKCTDNSILILTQTNVANSVIVTFEANLKVSPKKKSISYPVARFLTLCQKAKVDMISHRSNRSRSGNKDVSLGRSEGNLLSDLFTSKAHRLADFYINHAKDIPALRRKKLI